MPGSHAYNLESQRAALSKTSLLPLDAKDTKKARDAIIVAIGISSVLVINVAYVGYITTPGGPDQYWADCFYGVFVAYFVLNGFALVFSIAALCAVTRGPYVLIWCRVSGWRTRVVNVGLAHLAISLASLLGAFACAGFVVASVGAPELNCGNLRCTEGGVPCDAFSIEPAAEHYFMHSNQKKDWQPSVYVLNPALAKLNNKTFVNLAAKNASGGYFTGAGVDGQGVVCHSYSHIATFSELGNMAGRACEPRCSTPYDGLHGNGVLDDAYGRPINTTCLVLIDKVIWSQYQPNDQEEIAGHDSNLRLYSLLSVGVTGNPYTFWCSSNGSSLGPGWLPLPWRTAASLLNVTGPGNMSYTSMSHQNITRDGYAVEEAKGQGSATCPQVPGFKEHAKPLVRLPIPSGNFPKGSADLFPRGVELLGISYENKSAAIGACIPVYEAADYPDPLGIAAAAYTYATVLAGPPYGSMLDCPFALDSDSGYINAETLGNAIYYPSLQYQCSNLSTGVLCDYSVKPPLSVDGEGRFLDKKSLSKQRTVYMYVTSLTTSSVEYAVAAMLAVAFVAIFGTLAVLGGVQIVEAGLHYFRALICGRKSGHLVGASGAEIK